MTMLNYQALEQSRRGIQADIDQNPESIIIYRKPMVDGGFDKLVENPFGGETPTPLRVRLSKEARGPEAYSSTSSGLRTSETLYILVNHKTMIYINDEFEARDRNWRIGPVSQIKEFGGIVAYEAPLFEATKVQGAET
jgi:hypothetical protein